jgi:hypothetical protein
MRSGVVTLLFTGGRHSPEGERAVIERSRCDALKPEPEPIDAGEPAVLGVPFLEFDGVGSGNGEPR